MQIKAVSLTEEEIQYLIQNYGNQLHEDVEDKLERINYLHKRLKAFKEPEVIETIKSDNSAAGWGKTDA